MKKIVASICAVFFLTAWSIPDAHRFGNDTAVVIGTWCSGTVIRRDIVVTAEHCVESLLENRTRWVLKDNGFNVLEKYQGYKSVKITNNKFTAEGELFSTSSYTGTVLGVDKANDVAIIQMDISQNPNAFPAAAKISQKKLSYGDVVYAVGNPLMITFVATEGRVIHPQAYVKQLGERKFIMFDALIDKGSSGGALYNDNGELVGITNMIGPSGEGLAAPVDHVTALLKTLKIKDQPMIVAKTDRLKQ